MMKFRRPRSLNDLILVGFGIVALPPLVAVIWALVSLDRLAGWLRLTGWPLDLSRRLLKSFVGHLCSVFGRLIE
ncbi:MAG: hypothetical protein IIA12_07975 [Proteobacteria bacterium]|nr:hypothetical protein [Pseudomonadota bacterium]